MGTRVATRGLLCPHAQGEARLKDKKKHHDRSQEKGNSGGFLFEWGFFGVLNSTSCLFLNKGPPHFHFALGPTDYAADSGGACGRRESRRASA